MISGSMIFLSRNVLLLSSAQPRQQLPSRNLLLFLQQLLQHKFPAEAAMVRQLLPHRAEQALIRLCGAMARLRKMQPGLQRVLTPYSSPIITDVHKSIRQLTHNSQRLLPRLLLLLFYVMEEVNRSEEHTSE